MSQDKEAFLDRWSRLKQEQAKEDAAPPVEKKEAAPPVLPPVEELKPDSDFRPFMDPRVDGGTRRAALKKLFGGDPHFNRPDPFEAYCEDYTVGEPIPEAMLKTLAHARRVLFEERKPIEPLEKAPEPVARTPAPEAKDVPGKQDA